MANYIDPRQIKPVGDRLVGEALKVLSEEGGGGVQLPISIDDVTGLQQALEAPVEWDGVEGKPAVIAAGETQAEARTAIGAGTSSLAIGTTATTAAAGNHNHAVVAHAASGLAAAASIQALAQALSARIKALEDAASTE